LSGPGSAHVSAAPAPSFQRTPASACAARAALAISTGGSGDGDYPHRYGCPRTPPPRCPRQGRYKIQQIARRGVSASVFRSGGQFRESCRDIVEAVARYAARIAIERAHCVWLRIDIPATHILDLDL